MKGLSQNAGTISKDSVQYLRSGLSFAYPYREATVTPSKQTATQLKGRDKDHEAAENSSASWDAHHAWRNPSFIDGTVPSVSRGTAMHTVMQYISFDKCITVSGVKEEIRRLVTEGYISENVSSEIPAAQIARFFSTDLGRRILSEKEHVLREFKFSVLVDREGVTGEGADDQILLQGVVDCAIVDADGITIVDFKSDRVSANTIDETVSRYGPQLRAYSEAMSRIYQLPIKSAVLYFFQLDLFVAIE